MSKGTIFLVVAALVVGAVVGIAFVKIRGKSRQKVIMPVMTATIETSPSPIPRKVGEPKIISIPKIGVSASVENVGLDSQYRMDVPKNSKDTGWYQYGVRPGENGSAVIDGHLDTVTGAKAVFFNLNQLSPGDVINVTDENSKTYQFAVTATVSYPFDQVPLVQIFSSPGGPKLNLITCEGTWNSRTHNYSNRIVVYSIIKKS